jgi:hypothetical protein
MKRMVLAATLLALAAASAPAQSPKPAAKPAPALTAEGVLDRYVEVTGGAAAYGKHKSMVVKGKLEVVNAGVAGTLESYAVAPNRLSLTIAIDGFGTTRQVYDGAHGWESSPLNGVRELAGAELAVLKREATFNSDANWRALWKSVELVGTRPLGDRTANVVKLTPREGEGNPQTNFYDAETGLLVRTETVIDTAAATLPVTVVLSDYRDVGGVKIPFSSEQQLPSLTLKTVLTDATFDAKVDDAVFAKPQ